MPLLYGIHWIAGTNSLTTFGSVQAKVTTYFNRKKILIGYKIFL